MPARNKSIKKLHTDDGSSSLKHPLEKNLLEYSDNGAMKCFSLVTAGFHAVSNAAPNFNFSKTKKYYKHSACSYESATAESVSVGLANQWHLAPRQTFQADSLCSHQTSFC